MENNCKRKHAKWKTTKPKILTLLKRYKLNTKKVWIWVFNKYPLNLFPLGSGMVTCILMRWEWVPTNFVKCLGRRWGQVFTIITHNNHIPSVLPSKHPEVRQIPTQQHWFAPYPFKCKFLSFKKIIVLPFKLVINVPTSQISLCTSCWKWQKSVWRRNLAHNFPFFYHTFINLLITIIPWQLQH
jgi:hypothetical protein